MTKWVEKIEFVIGMILLSAITLLVFGAAVTRYFGEPIIWSIDLSKMMFLWLCFIGATRAMRERGHLGVDFLVRLFSHRWRLIVETLMAVAFIIVMFYLGKEGVKLAFQNIEREYGDSGLPYYLVTLSVPVGFVLLSLQILANTVDAWGNIAKEKTLIFGRKSDILDQISEL